jgi:hypothetical protein
MRAITAPNPPRTASRAGEAPLDLGGGTRDVDAVDDVDRQATAARPRHEKPPRVEEPEATGASDCHDADPGWVAQGPVDDRNTELQLLGEGGHGIPATTPVLERSDEQMPPHLLRLRQHGSHRV